MSRHGMTSMAKIFALIFSVAVSGALPAADYLIEPLGPDLQPIVQASATYNAIDFKIEDALNIALSENRAIINSELAVNKAEGQVRQARSITGIKVSANMTQTRLDEVASANFGGQNMKLGLLDNQKIWVEMAQPLFLGLKDRAAIKSSRLGRDIANSAHTLTRQQIVMAASIGYYSWLYAREVEDVGKMNLDLSQAHYDLVNKRYQAQQASKYELLRAEVRMVQTRSGFLKEQNDSQLAQLELLKLLSLPLDTELNTSCRLEAEKISPEVAEDLKDAERQREDLKIKRTENSLAAESVVAARGEKQPTIALFGQVGSEDPSTKSAFGALERKSYWLAGVSVNLPVLDAGFSSGKVVEAKAGLKQSENAYSNSLEQAQLEIRKAALTLNTSEQIVTSQKENLKQAEETVRLAKVRYENGMFTQVDLFDAENAWSNARLLYIQAVFQHHQARLAYLLATGKLGRDLWATTAGERNSR